jgi:hypothetical protein
MNRRDLLCAAPALSLLPLVGKLLSPPVFGTLFADVPAEGFALGSWAYLGTAADLTFTVGAVKQDVQHNWMVLEDCRILSARPVRDASLEESADLEWLPWGSRWPDRDADYA